jgi:penicillin-binding protein 2
LPNSTHRFRDWRPKGHGRVDLVSAIAQSCDVYFYELATRLGVQRLSDFLGSFGLGARTGIDIAGEKTGLVPSPEWKRGAFKSRRAQVWFPGETVILGIGQGYMTTTPLQLAHMAGIISLRGTSVQPRLVRSLRDPTTRKMAPVAPKMSAGPEVGDAKNWDLAIAGMFAVTHGGTASRSAAGAPYSIAGKTGTAQVFSIAQNAKYDEGAISERMRDHAWFIAFAPVEAPKIAVAVLVENGRSGSGTAAPIARLVMDAYLLRKFPTNGNAAAAAAGDSSEE